MDLRRLAQNARSAQRARRRIERTGLTPNGHKIWRNPEPENLQSNYPNYDAAVRLNTNRTRPAHYSKAGRMGITWPAPRRWGENELFRLRRDYPRLTKEELLERFPGRSWGAICRKANQRGIFRQRRLFKPTGRPLLDVLLARAWEEKRTLADLDHIARRRGYFVGRRWARDPSYISVVCRVIEQMGGTIRAKWSASR